MLFIIFYYEKNSGNNAIFLNIMLHQTMICKYCQNSLYEVMNLGIPKERVNTHNSTNSNSLICGDEFLNKVQVKCNS